MIAFVLKTCRKQHEAKRGELEAAIGQLQEELAASNADQRLSVDRLGHCRTALAATEAMLADADARLDVVFDEKLTLRCRLGEVRSRADALQSQCDQVSRFVQSKSNF